MPEPLLKKVDSALQMLAQDQQLTIRIHGNCMLPLIASGARVSVSEPSFYWPGDVLVKRCNSGQLIAHRLIGCYPRKGQLYYVTRADNAEAADAAIPGEQIIGRITGGECAHAVCSIPAGDRLKAMTQFVALVTKKLFAGARRSEGDTKS